MSRHKRPKHEREFFSFLGAVKRFLRAAGLRAAQGDEPELAALLALQADLDEAIQVAVDGQRAVGRSWAHIALATGQSRQAAFKRWGGRETQAANIRLAVNAEEAIRRAYRGGNLYLAPSQPGQTFDVNSLYPASVAQ